MLCIKVPLNVLDQTFKPTLLSNSIKMPADDSPAVLVARFLRANNYTEVMRPSPALQIVH